MNILAEFVSMIETGLTLADFKVLADDGKRTKYGIGLRASTMRNNYRRTEDKFMWYLSLTIDEADRLYMLLLRRAGERQNMRKEKRKERREYGTSQAR